MKKVETSGDFFPNLRPYEIKWNIKEGAKKFELISEPRHIDTKFGDNQTIIDLKLPKIPDKDVYLDEGTKKEEREQRLDGSKRSWFPNAKSINQMVDEFGKDGELDDSEIPELKVELETKTKDIKGEKTLVIYVKGADDD